MDITEYQFIPHGLDQGRMPVTGRLFDCPSGFRMGEHSHPTLQLMYAQQGVMVVTTDAGQWVVPPTRGLWIPANTSHSVRMVGIVQLRSLYVRPDAGPNLPTECCVVSISPLLRELILAAVEIQQPYRPDSREARLVALLLDELAALPSLPLRLPQPEDPDLARLCASINAEPDESITLAEWAQRLGVNARTLQRRFTRQTGMTFGQWRQQARLISALEQLAGGAKVIDVALNLGYNSPNAFTTMFKRQFGVTPSVYFR